MTTTEASLYFAQKIGEQLEYNRDEIETAYEAF